MKNNLSDFTPMPHNSPELVEAALDGDLAAVRALVEAGADLNSCDEHGIGPLLSFTPAVTEYLLLQGADPNRQTNESGASVLSGVAYMFATDCVRLLLAAGADPNAGREETAATPLHACLSRPHDQQYAVVKLLLEHRADPNRRTVPGLPDLAFWRDVRTRGETPLHRAAAYAAEETIRLLLKYGADKTLRDANGDSPQSWASHHWRPKPLIDLLDPRPAA